MQTVTVDKAELVDILNKNMVIHEADFELAWKGYQKKAVERAQIAVSNAANAVKGSVINLNISLSAPINHKEDYMRAIEMCAWEKADEVKLMESEFRQLVQDQWSWKENFTTSNMMYTGAASPSSGR